MCELRVSVECMAAAGSVMCVPGGCRVKHVEGGWVFVRAGQLSVCPVWLHAPLCVCRVRGGCRWCRPLALRSLFGGACSVFTQFRCRAFAGGGWCSPDSDQSIRTRPYDVAVTSLELALTLLDTPRHPALPSKNLASTSTETRALRPGRRLARRSSMYCRGWGPFVQCPS